MKRLLKFLAYTIALLLLITAIGAFLNWHSDLSREVLAEKYHYPNSKTIEVQGMKVHYREVGQGMPLVLLHGTGASLHTWEGWMEQLSADYRVIAMDLPAFGLTGPHPQRDYSMDAYTSFVKGFMDEIGIDSCHIAGNSLGGMICWNFALRYPERLGKMILLDASGYPSDKPMPLAFRIAQNDWLKGLLTHITPKALHRKSLLDVYGNDEKVTNELVDRYFELMLREGNRQAFVDRSNQVFIDYSTKIPSIQTPTLILWGEEDSWVEFEHAKQFDDDLPNSKLITYPSIGHIPMEEIPRQTAADALNFLKEPIANSIVTANSTSNE